MPQIWLDYLKFLMHQGFIVKTRFFHYHLMQSLIIFPVLVCILDVQIQFLCRLTFNRALQSLPVTQHSRIWTVLAFLSNQLIYFYEDVTNACINFFSTIQCQVYLEYLIKFPELTQTLTRAYRRYIKVLDNLQIGIHSKLVGKLFISFHSTPTVDSARHRGLHRLPGEGGPVG